MVGWRQEGLWEAGIDRKLLFRAALCLFWSWETGLLVTATFMHTVLGPCHFCRSLVLVPAPYSQSWGWWPCWCAARHLSSGRLLSQLGFTLLAGRAREHLSLAFPPPPPLHSVPQLRAQGRGGSWLHGKISLVVPDNSAYTPSFCLCCSDYSRQNQPQSKFIPHIVFIQPAPGTVVTYVLTAVSDVVNPVSHAEVCVTDLPLT